MTEQEEKQIKKVIKRVPKNSEAPPEDVSAKTETVEAPIDTPSSNNQNNPIKEKNFQNRNNNHKKNNSNHKKNNNHNHKKNNNHKQSNGEYDIGKLKSLKLEELHVIGEKLEIPDFRQMLKNDLIFKILETQSEEECIYAKGVLDILPDGFGFLRTNNYLPSAEDIYVSQSQIRRHSLASGDMISGQVRPPKEGERYYSLIKVDSVNNKPLEFSKKRTLFTNLVPIYPDSMIRLETGQSSTIGRMIDLVAPIGRGQRGVIVSPPKAGKTTILKDIAHSISMNYPEVHIKVLLIDERPEEVTDMERSVNGEVISSTFDEPPERHIKVSELVLESAKRMVEFGEHVVILLDSITRLARAYNLVMPPSGRTLSGGLDPSSLHKPKRFFGGARNIENGGSLTILATALVDTGSRMDDVIYEEFKGTGNMELHLNRNMANRRIFPAIDVVSSGTRKEELLVTPEVLKKMYSLRKNIDNDNATEELIRLLKHSHSNEEFLSSSIFAHTM